MSKTKINLGTPSTFKPSCPPDTIGVLPRLYIAGPMRGIKDFNFPAFDAAAKVLRDAGYIVVSPADLDRAAGYDLARLNQMNSDELKAALRTLLAQDVVALCACEGVALLPKWEKSKGVAAELGIAWVLELHMKPATQWVEEVGRLDEHGNVFETLAKIGPNGRE